MKDILARIRALPEAKQVPVAKLLLTPAELASAMCIRECGRLARDGEDDCQPCADERVRQLGVN